MSSSLEYLLASFDEEAQAASGATSAMAYPCYDNSPWIASGSTSRPLLGSTAYPETDATALRQIREVSNPPLLGYPTFNPRVSSLGSTGSATAGMSTSDTSYGYQRSLYSNNSDGDLSRSSPAGTSTSTGSTASPSVASVAASHTATSASPATPTAAAPAESASTTAPRPRSPPFFTYRPRSQQERLRTLFPDEDPAHLEQMTRTVRNIVRASDARGEQPPWMNLVGDMSGAAMLNGGLFGLMNDDSSIQTIDFEGGTNNLTDLAFARNLAMSSSSGGAGGTLASPLDLTSPRLGSLDGDNLGETTANFLAHLAPRAISEPLSSMARRRAGFSSDFISTSVDTDAAKEEDSKPSATKTSIRKRSSPSKAEEEPAPKKLKPDEEATCCICLEIPTKEDLASISGCSHPFCFGCIEKWADRENTCPLCKARFSKIEKVNGESSEKTVSDKNQRSDYLSLLSGMDLFGGLGAESANGTWPTHIAQLLFSGLGASSVGGRGNRRMGASMHRLSVSDRDPPPEAPRHASVGAPAPPRVGFSTRRPSAYASSFSGASARAPSAAAGTEPITDFLDRVHRNREREQQQRENLAARTFSSMSAVVTSTSTYPSLLSPFQRTTTRSTTATASWDRVSPSGATSTAANALAGHGQNLFSSINLQREAARAFPSPNPFAYINLQREEEEEEILASSSPTSYIQRMQRDLDRNTELYQFSTSGTASAPSASGPNGQSAFNSSPGSFGESRENMFNREAGRSAETAFEIDDSDSDEDVEIVGIEAMM